jgi:hypothetical protein
MLGHLFTFSGISTATAIAPSIHSTVLNLQEIPNTLSIIFILQACHLKYERMPVHNYTLHINKAKRNLMC